MPFKTIRLMHLASLFEPTQVDHCAKLDNTEWKEKSSPSSAKTSRIPDQTSLTRSYTRTKDAPFSSTPFPVMGVKRTLRSGPVFLLPNPDSPQPRLAASQSRHNHHDISTPSQPNPSHPISARLILPTPHAWQIDRRYPPPHIRVRQVPVSCFQPWHVPACTARTLQVPWTYCGTARRHARGTQTFFPTRMHEGSLDIDIASIQVRQLRACHIRYNYLQP
jgi:hypothetical protein